MDSDAIFYVYGFLELPDIQSCSIVDKQFHKAATNELIWKSLFDIKFNDIPVDGYHVNYQRYHVLDNFLIKSIKINVNDAIKSQILNLSGYHLNFIPSEIGLLLNLQTLSLSNNQLESIPSEIGLLLNLHTLCLGHNQLKSIPSKIGLLLNLQTLYLYDNQLESIPSEISLLLNLQYIWLDNTQLILAPNEVKHLIRTP